MYLSKSLRRVPSSLSQRSGMNLSGFGKMTGLECMRTLVIPIGVPGGITYFTVFSTACPGGLKVPSYTSASSGAILASRVATPYDKRIVSIMVAL
jgi:hypothetical protein